MRYLDEDEAKKINAEPWQLALLAANPGYLGWGPHEDYMCGKGEGWNSRIIVPTWAEFGPWALDDLNECVNFYFEVSRASEECKTCGGNGHHPQAQEVQRSFYDFEGTGARWVDNITQDECDALIAEKRLPEGTAVATVNAANAHGGTRHWSLNHDGINRSILIERRLDRMGLPKTCPACEGSGYTYTEPAAHVSLILWWLHPRKGCSRGIEVTRLERNDLPAVKAFLAEAATRNADRFKGIALIA